MKIGIPFASLFLALALAGCGQKDAAPAAGAAGTSAAAAPAPASGPRLIEITAGLGDQMKYTLPGVAGDVPLVLEAKAGQEIKVVLTNAGTLPKEVMGHNWVLLKAGSDAATFAAAAAVAKDTDYVPVALKDQVVAHIETLGPRKSGEVTFTPTAPGEYPFLCSFPGHFILMKGTIVVK